MSIFDKWNKKYGDKGLGDTIARSLDTISRGNVKPCSKCNKRKKALNEFLPYNKDRR